MLRRLRSDPESKNERPRTKVPHRYVDSECVLFGSSFSHFPEGLPSNSMRPLHHDFRLPTIPDIYEEIPIDLTRSSSPDPEDNFGDQQPEPMHGLARNISRIIDRAARAAYRNIKNASRQPTNTNDANSTPDLNSGTSTEPIEIDFSSDSEVTDEESDRPERIMTLANRPKRRRSRSSRGSTSSLQEPAKQRRRSQGPEGPNIQLLVAPGHACDGRYVVCQSLANFDIYS